MGFEIRDKFKEKKFINLTGQNVLSGNKKKRAGNPALSNKIKIKFTGLSL
jgi:hypothetical protein